MALSACEPWAIKCSNAWGDDNPDEKGVQLRSLAWSYSSPAVPSLAGSRSQTPLTSVRPNSVNGTAGKLVSLNSASLNPDAWYMSMFDRCPSQSSQVKSDKIKRSQKPSQFNDSNSMHSWDTSNSRSLMESSAPRSTVGAGQLTSILTFNQTTLMPSVLSASRQTRVMAPDSCETVDSLTRSQAASKDCLAAERSEITSQLLRVKKSHGQGRSLGARRKLLKPNCTDQYVHAHNSSLHQPSQASRQARSRRRKVINPASGDCDATGRKQVSFTGLVRSKWEWQSEKEERVLKQYYPEAFDNDAAQQRREISEKTMHKRVKNNTALKDDLFNTLSEKFSKEQEESAKQPPKPKEKKEKTSVMQELDMRTLRLVFRKFADKGGVILRPRLRPALILLGYDEKEVSDEQIKEVVKDIEAETGLRPVGFDFDTFVRFCEDYDTEHLHGALKKFRQFDVDGNGILDAHEVSLLLKSCNITVMPGVVQDIITEVCEDGETVKIDEFDKLMHVIRARGGFSKHESDKFHSLYARYDSDGSGTIDKKELLRILNWLSLFGDKPDCKRRAPMTDAIMKAFRLYGTDQVELPEFLHLMRKSREMEVNEITAIFSKLDAEDGNPSGSLDLGDTVKLLQGMGFRDPKADVALECFADCGVTKRVEYYLEDILRMTRAFHEMEGFSKAQFREFQEAFETNDVDGSKAIDAIELGGVMRWLGNPADFEATQDLMEQIDMDKSGQVDFDEFLRVMRRFQEDEMDRVEHIFKSADYDDSGGLSLKELKFMILTLGYQPTEEQYTALRSNYSAREATYDECVILVRALHDDAHLEFIENQGFKPKERQRLRKLFDKYDRHGGFSAQNLHVAVGELYPEFASMSDSADEVDKFLQKFDIAGDKLDFMKYLKIMRMVADRADYALYMKQRQAALEHGFTPAQVMEIRKIFKLADDDCSNMVTFKELQQLFVRVYPVPPEIAKTLFDRLRQHDENGDQQLDFVEFLSLIKSMQDSGIDIVLP